MKNTKTNCVEWIYYAYLSKDSRKLHKRPFCTIIQPMNDSNYGIFARPDKVRGIIAIRNLKSGRALLEKTEDAVKAFKDERFRLDLGLHGSKELQAESAARMRTSMPRSMNAKRNTGRKGSASTIADDQIPYRLYGCLYRPIRIVELRIVHSQKLALLVPDSEENSAGAGTKPCRYREERG